MAGRHGSLPLRVAVVVSGWGSCSCGKSILAPPYHRTTVPPNSVPSYPHTSVPPRNTIHIPPPYVSAGVRFAPTCRGRPPCLPVFRCFVCVLEMAGRHGSLPLRVAVVVSGWGSCSCGKSILAPPYHRTTVPPNSVPSYPHTSVPPRNTIHIPPPWGKATGRRALLGMGPGWGAGPLFPLRQSGSHSAGWLTRFSQRQAVDTDDALGALIFRQRGK